MNSQIMEEKIELFQPSDDDHQKTLYRILSSILDGIKKDELKTVENCATVLGKINSLTNEEMPKTLRQCPENPIHKKDLISIACEHGSVNVLEFILDKNGNFLQQIYSGEENIPSISPGEPHSHNCFYYAIRSNNFKILSLLLNTFPTTFYITSKQELDEILSDTYEELKIKKIPLMPYIEFAVEQKIIDVRFYTENVKKGHQIQVNNIVERVRFLLNVINMLHQEKHKHDDNVSEEILLMSKHIVLNIHILKGQLKYSYDRLPWEEIEFSVIIFIYSHQKKDFNNLIYQIVMTKNKVLSHLDNFAKRLNSLLPEIKKTPPKLLFRSIRIAREKVMTKITNDSPEFKELYEDFHKVRDVYSLQQMSDVINLAAKARPQVAEERLVIIRTLQILGECLKNTLDSPKLSSYISELLIASAPKQTREIIIDLRDSLSHSDSLKKRMEIENDSESVDFLNIQDDMKNLGNVIRNILHDNKERTLKWFLTLVVDDPSVRTQMTHTRLVSPGLNINFLLPEEPFKTSVHDTIKELFCKIKCNISEITDYDQNILRKIEDILYNSPDINHGLAKFFTHINFPFPVNMNNDELFRLFRHFQISAKMAVNFRQYPQKDLKTILNHLGYLMESVALRHKDIILNDFLLLGQNLLYLLEYKTGKIEWIEILQDKLGKEKKPSTKKPNKDIGTPDPLELINSKLSQLTKILEHSTFDFTVNQNVFHYKENLINHSIIEMCVLDVLSLLQEVGELLPNNTLTSLDDTTCLLNGRNLRNFLAHGNTYIEILPSSPSGAIISNALKLIKDNVNGQKKQQIGKVQLNKIEKLTNRFSREMEIVNLQMTMFEILEKEGLDKLKACISQGADILSRNTKMMTTLHCAAKGTSLDIIKFLIEQRVDVFLVDSDGNNAVHIAAMHGRGSIVDYLLTTVQLEVNATNSRGETPMHIAAMYGQYKVVEILLKRNACSHLIDKFNLRPICYSVINNHLNILKILVLKKTFRKPTTSYSLNLLLPAIMYGHRDMVDFFLQNGHNANEILVETMTPLQVATFFGHIDIIRTLIYHGTYSHKDGHISLTMAIDKEAINIVKLFLESGVKPDNVKNYLHFPLHRAAKCGFKEILLLLLHFQADVNGKDILGWTALHVAVKNKRKEIVEELLKKNAAVNIANNSGLTPLQLAILNQDTEIVNILLKNEANVDIRDIDSPTPLHTAAFAGNLGIVRTLLEYGGNVNISTNQGLTPLYLSIRFGQKDVSKYLISQGANIQQCSNRYSCLHYAAINGDEEMTNLLLDTGININDKDRWTGSTALSYAASSGHRNLIEILLTRGADIDTRNYQKYSPLDKAIIKNHIEIVKLLVQTKPSIVLNVNPLYNALNHNREEIVDFLITHQCDLRIGHLERAIHLGNENIVIRLLRSMAPPREASAVLCLAVVTNNQRIFEALPLLSMDCNVINRDGETPVMVAALCGNTNALNLLISHGADIHKVSYNGDTALHWAVRKSHREVVNILMKNKIDSNKINKQGRTALDIAVLCGLIDVLEEILKNDTNILNNYCGEMNLLHSAVRVGNCNVVQLLLDCGADTNQTDECGWKLLPLVIDTENTELTRIILSHEKKLKSDSVFENSWSIIHSAVTKGNPEILECVLNNKVHVDARDPSGSTPLHVAASRGDLETFKLLVKHGATYNSVNSLKQTPQDVATIEISQVLSGIDYLFDAVKSGIHINKKQIKSLEDYLDSKDNSGKTLLHYAIIKKLNGLTHDLLNCEVNCDSRDSEGKTPLHYACEENEFNIIIDLCAKGAIYDKLDIYSKSPKEYAREEQIMGFFSVIETSFLRVNNNSENFCSKFYTFTEPNLLKALINVRDVQNNTSLVIAGLKNCSPAIKDLKIHLSKNVDFKLSRVKIYLQQKSLTNARKYLSFILLKRIKTFGKYHPWVWEVQKYKAKILFEDLKYDEALQILIEIHEKQIALLGRDNEHSLHTRSFIASILLGQGAFEEALQICQDIYNKQLLILRKHHKNILKTQRTLAMAKYYLGQYDDALRNFVEIINITKEYTSAEVHPPTLAMLQHFEVCLSKQERTEDALLIFKEIDNYQLKLSNSETITTLDILLHIASIYTITNRDLLALKIYSYTLNKLIQIHGHDQKEIEKTIFFIECLRLLMSNHNSGIPNTTQFSGEVFDNDHPCTKDIQKNLKSIQDNLVSNRPLHINNFDEIRYQDVDYCSKILKNAVDINYKDMEGRTLLNWGVKEKRIDLIEYLLTKQSDITTVNIRGHNPLHTAVAQGSRDIVEILLNHAKLTMPNHGANYVNSKTDNSKSTSLHVAVKLGDLNIVKLLLMNGAMFNCTDKYEHTPIFYSRDKKIWEILKLIEDCFKEALTGDCSTINKVKTENVYDVNCILNAQNCEGISLKYLLQNM